MSTLVLDERDTIAVRKAERLRDGDVVTVPMRVVALRNGRLVLHPEGRMTDGGIVVSARKVKGG